MEMPRWARNAAIAIAAIALCLMASRFVVPDTQASMLPTLSYGYGDAGTSVSPQMAAPAGSEAGASAPRSGDKPIGIADTTVDAMPRPIPEGGSSGESHGLKVVKTGTLVISSTDPSVAVERLKASAAKHGGFVDNESVTLGDSPQGIVVFRVESGRYEAFVADAKKAGKVESIGISKSDQTKQYADAKALLRSNEAELAAVGKLLGQAKSVQDVLAIRQQTEQLRSESQQLRSTLSSIDDQASYSTLTVEIRTPAAIRGEDQWGRGTVQALVSVFQASLRSVVLFAAALLPWALVALAAWGVIALTLRARRKGSGNK